MNKLLIAACSLALGLGTDSKKLVLVPDGEFKGLDGRPGAGKSWRLTPENGRKIVAALNQQRIDMVVDWEHATLLAKKDGSQAPASGWCRQGKFEYVEGVGVCSADWSWTKTAAGQIEDEEYRYLSPVFLYLPNGDVTDLLHASLTNTPNLDVMPEVMLAAASQIYANSQEGDSNVDEILEQLRWMLNLPLSATAEDVSAELGKLQERIKAETGVEVAANGKNLLDGLDGYKALAVAANSQTIVDPTKYAPIAVVHELQKQIAAFAALPVDDPVEPLIQAALSDGRLLAANTAQVDWARNYGKSDLEGMRTMLDAMPKIQALTSKQTSQPQISANSRQHNQPAALDADALAIAEQMGNDPLDVAKYV